MNFLSICSGIEAASVAWTPLGWKAVGFSEIAKFPSAVLAHHYPNVPNFGDLTKSHEWPELSINLLCGGTPCQAFSVAGLRAGLADPRGNLTLTFLGVAAKYRPRWVVWENVPGVLSDRTNAFGQFLAGLGQLGYGWAYRVLDAQYFGVPQRRRRVFVVAYLGDWRRAASVLFEPESLRGDSPPCREKGEVVAPTISARSSGGGGLGTDFDLDGGIVHSLRGEGFDATEDGTGRGTPLVSLPILAGHQRNDPETLIAFSQKDHGADAGSVSPTLRSMGHANSHANSHANGGGQIAIAFDPTQITSRDNRSNPQPGDPCHTLAKGAYAPAIAFESRFVRNGRGAPSDIVPPLKAQSGETGKGDGAPLVSLNLSVRRLTPVECERLQGFPDHYTNIPWRGKGFSPDGPRYKALGNSWAVPCARWIGERIARVDNNFLTP